MDHLFKRVSVRKASSPHANVLLQSEIFDLMQNSLSVIFAWAAVLVRLDGSDVGWLGSHELLNQSVGRSLDETHLVSHLNLLLSDSRALTLILSLAVGGRFLESGSGRSGKSVPKKGFGEESTRFRRSLLSVSLFLSVMPRCE